jgi:hypothetical protein
VTSLLNNIAMRASILIVAAAVLVTRASPGQAWTAPPWDKAVVVRKLDEDFPAKQEKVWKFLVSRLNTPEVDAFKTLTTSQWKVWLPLFEKGLVEKAKKESLDTESLQQCLSVVAESNRVAQVAYLPVAAYSTKQGDIPVWIIVARWSDYHDAKTPPPSLPLIHIRTFAFDARKRSVIGFASCN